MIIVTNDLITWYSARCLIGSLWADIKLKTITKWFSQRVLCTVLYIIGLEIFDYNKWLILLYVIQFKRRALYLVITLSCRKHILWSHQTTFSVKGNEIFFTVRIAVTMMNSYGQLFGCIKQQEHLVIWPMQQLDTPHMDFLVILMFYLGIQRLLESRYSLLSWQVKLLTSRMLLTFAIVTCLQPDLPWVKLSSHSGDHWDMQPMQHTFACS